MIASRGNSSRRHGLVKSRHSANRQAARRNRSVGAVAGSLRLIEAKRRGTPAQCPADTVGGVAERGLEPKVEALREEPLRFRLGQDLEPRIDPRLDRPLVQDIGAEPVDGANLRLLEVGDRLLETTLPALRVDRAAGGVRRAGLSRPLEIFPEPQLQLAGRLLGERHGENLVHARAARRENIDDARDQLACLAGAGRRFDHQPFVEGVAYPLSGRGVNEWCVAHVLADPVTAGDATRTDRRASSRP